MKSKNTVLFLITAFTLATISTLIGCEKQLLIMKMDDTKAPEKEPTQIHGIGEFNPGSLYTFGTIIIGHDAETWEQAYKKYTPITTVNDFLVSKGYTPKVRGIFPGRFIVIDIGKNIDPLPLLGELQTVPGVTSVQLNSLFEYARVLWWDTDPWTRVGKLITANKVGKMINGQLFELGVLLVRYDEPISLLPIDMAPPVVAVLKSLSDKGYEPTVTDVIHSSRVHVIDLGENLDPSPLLKELRTIPGVRGVRLNTLHDLLDGYTPGKIAGF